MILFISGSVLELNAWMSAEQSEFKSLHGFHWNRCNEKCSSRPSQAIFLLHGSSRLMRMLVDGGSSLCHSLPPFSSWRMNSWPLSSHWFFADLVLLFYCSNGALPFTSNHSFWHSSASRRANTSLSGLEMRIIEIVEAMMLVFLPSSPSHWIKQS